jgi:hypothetical protein
MLVNCYWKNSKTEPIYFPETWHITRKNGKVEFFKKGDGYKKVAESKVSQFMIEDMRKLDYTKIKNTYDKYGRETTMELLRECPEIKDCEMALPAYITIANGAKNTEHLNLLEKFGFSIRRNVDKLICFGMFSFPVIALDDFCHLEKGYSEEKHGSLKNFLYKYLNIELELF